MSSWTVPRRALQIVAFLLIAVSAGSFALGVASNLQRGGHLPGAQILSGVTGQAPVEAEDAVPLSNERIQGPPPPSEEKKAAGNKEEDLADQADEAPAGNAASAGNAATPLPSLPPPPAGNAAPSDADEPPH